MKSFFKTCVFLVLNAFTPRLGNRASVLLYHSINNKRDYFSAISPEAFERQMAYLAKKKYQVISLTELVRRLRGKETLGGAIVLTFDDGYADNYENVLPVLKRYSFPATIFVTTGMQSEASRNEAPLMLSKAQMHEMLVSNLIDFMPHSVTHPKFDRIPFEEAVREIESSRASVDRIINKPADIFAFPYGRFTKEIIEFLRMAGKWQAVVTVHPGLVRNDADRFMLPRNSIDSESSFAEFKAKISLAIDWYTLLKTSLRI